MNAIGRPTRPQFLAALAAGAAATAIGRPARAADTVNIINTGSNDSLALQALIKNKRYFDAVGIGDNTQNVSDGVKLMAAILTGQADVSILTGFSQIFPAIENGAQIKLLGGAVLPSNFVMYTGNPAIKSVKDLAGKTIGTGAVGALVYIAAAALLKRYGVDPATVTFVNIGSSSDVFRAVAAKKIDAGPAQHEFTRLAGQLGVRGIATFATDLPLFTQQGAFTTDRAIAEKRDVLVRTLAAYGKAYRYVDSPGSKADYLQAFADAVGPGTAEQAEDLWTWFQQYKAYDAALVLTPERVAYMQQVNVDLGIQKSVLPFEKVADMSIARDALKLMR
jgi:ABC-type nitrate/sulfonate/bicarbonate transport system substrate-binding protein